MGFHKGRFKTQAIMIALVPAFMLIAWAGYVYLNQARSPSKSSSSFSRNPATSESLGALTLTKNDTRYKSSSSLAWSATQEKQNIQVGDSIFAGTQSSAEVSLNKGGNVSVGENSLVVFSEIEKEKVANFMRGNFRLSVKGEAKVAIRGKVTKIEGRNSDVQIATNENNQPQLKVLSGKVIVQLDENKPPVEVSDNQVIDIPQLTQEEMTKLPESVTTAPEVTEIQPVEPPKPVRYYLFSDFTEANGTLTIAKVTPEPEYAVKTPTLNLSADEVKLIGLDAQAQATLEAESTAVESLVLLSQDSRFEKSEILRAASRQIRLTFKSPGVYFVKGFVINAKSEISPWSEVKTLKVMTPPKLPAPKLAESSIEIFEGQILSIRWAAVNGAKSYQCLIGQSKTEMTQIEVNKTSCQSQETPGVGQFIVQARDQWGRLGAKAEGAFAVNIKPQPIPTPEPPVTPKKPTEILDKPEWVHLQNFFLWLGYGLSYTSVDQDAGGMSSLNLGAMKTGAMVFRGGFWLNQYLGLDLSYSQTPGNVKSSSSLTINPSSYTWSTMSVEGLWGLTDDPSAQWILRGGFQNHSVPFFVPQSSTRISTYENEILMASLGFEYQRKITDKSRFELLMRYQQPLSSSSVAGTTYTVTTPLSFDGSVGAAYMIRPNLYYGLYWHGQSLRYRFDYQDRVTNTGFSGSQDLFHSTLDLRLGVEF